MKNEPSTAPEFVARLRQVTAEFGSRYALAKASGIPASTLQSYEAGSKPGIDALVTLARVVNLDLNWLLTGKGEIRPAGMLPGAALADVVPVNEYQMGAALSTETIKGRVPFSRHLLEARLRLSEPTHDSLLVVEADWNLYDIARGDLVLIDRKQSDLARDGVYLLDLPGIALRAIVKDVRDKVSVVGPEHEAARVAERGHRAGRGQFSTTREMRLTELLGDGRFRISKVVGRAVWVGRAI